MLDWLLRLLLFLLTILIFFHRAIARRSVVFLPTIASFDSMVKISVVSWHFMV